MRIAHAQVPNLIERSFAAIGFDFHGIEQRGGSAARANFSKFVPDIFYGFGHAVLAIGGNFFDGIHRSELGKLKDYSMEA
jgi:hypothetical protein